MRRSRLLFKYWIALAVLATLPTLAGGAIEVWRIYHLSYRYAIERQMSEARQASYVVERSVLPAVDRLKVTAGIPWNYDTATTEALLGEMRRLVRQFDIIERVQAVAPDGSIRAFYAQDGRPRAPEPSEREAFAPSATEANGTPVVLKLGRRGLHSVAFRLHGTADMIVADLRTDVVNKVVTEIVGRNGFVLITDGEGRIIGHPELSLVYSETRLQDMRGWSAAMDGTRIFAPRGPVEHDLGEVNVQVSNDPAEHSVWFVAYRQLPELKWGVFALAPSAVMRGELRDAVRGTVVTLVSANLLALLLAVALANRMSRPLSILADASERVADGDLSARARVTSDDEVGRLSEQFNAMVEQLEQNYGELEARVAEKTSALERANRHKSEFLAQMSHELRTPLNAVIAASDVLLNPAYFGALNEKQEEYLRDIHESGQHLLSLINDLLDLAKIEAGRMELSLSPVPVVSLMESCVALVRERAQVKRITLEQRCDDHPDTWVMDGRRTKQVLVNLLSNAVKFTPEGGAVTVMADLVDGPGGRQLRFCVTDSGIGIERNQIANLFRDFEQLRPQGQPPVEGTGLGLALSQRIVRLHGSEITVESDVGKGSRFCFALQERAWPAN